MSARFEEFATNAATQIFLKMMDKHTLLNEEAGSPPKYTGTNLANQLGECYQALYKKIYGSLKQP